MAVQHNKGALNPNANLDCSTAHRKGGSFGRKCIMYNSETKKKGTSPEDSGI